MFPAPEDFVVAWQNSESVGEASQRLVACGFRKMTPRRVAAWARVFREAGVRLRRMRVPNFICGRRDQVS